MTWTIVCLLGYGFVCLLEDGIRWRWLSAFAAVGLGFMLDLASIFRELWP